MAGRRRTGPPQPEQWLHLAVRYLARWDRTVSQVEQFLRSKGASTAQVKQTLNRLSDLRYLNDLAYAQRWVESRLTRKPMGRERLKAELLAKGVAESVAEKAMGEAFREVDEETLARQALKAAQRKGRRLTPLQAFRLLRQRGFGDELIHRMIPAGPETEGMDA